MSGDSAWREVAEISLRGPSHDQAALRISDLHELRTYQAVITETAKQLWRRQNPDRERAPRGFDESTILRFTHLREGSAVVPLEARETLADQGELWDIGPHWIRQAVELTWRGWQSAQRGERMPDDLPPSVISKMETLGETLDGETTIGVAPAWSPSDVVNIDERVRAAVATMAPGRFEDIIVTEGRVELADVRRRRFRLFATSGQELPGPFQPSDETIVTGALYDHASRLVRVEGQALYESDGTPVRFLDVLRITSLDDENADVAAIWTWLADFASNESVAGLPSDLSENLDDYLYGGRKRVAE